MSSTAGLEVRDVVGGYGAVPYLRGISLSVQPGEIVALLGANGAGKTSTVMTIAGHVKVRSGSCSFNGQPLRGAAHLRARQGLGLVTQERSAFMDLSLRDNLALGRGETRAVIEMFPELEAHLDRRAGLLSGGQQQMLAVGRILAGRPSLVLIDELSLGLAPMVVDRILDALDEYRKVSGAAVLLVEQHIHKALAVADRAYVLQRGTVAMQGTTQELHGQLDVLHRAYLPGG